MQGLSPRHSEVIGQMKERPTEKYPEIQGRNKEGGVLEPRGEILKEEGVIGGVKYCHDFQGQEMSVYSSTRPIHGFTDDSQIFIF